MRIEPTVGRVVHYHPAPDHRDHGNVLTAFICKVHDNGSVNLAIFDSDGMQFSRLRVQYADQQGDDYTGHWSWMPYQLGQAAKTDHVIDAAIELIDQVIDQARTTAPRAPVELMDPHLHVVDERGVPTLFEPAHAGLSMNGQQAQAQADEATRLRGE